LLVLGAFVNVLVRPGCCKPVDTSACEWSAAFACWYAGNGTIDGSGLFESLDIDVLSSFLPSIWSSGGDSDNSLPDDCPPDAGVEGALSSSEDGIISKCSLSLRRWDDSNLFLLSVGMLFGLYLTAPVFFNNTFSSSVSLSFISEA
jgi:hypothetical protein